MTSTHTLDNKLPFLDGLRGLLAIWVFWGHLSAICGMDVPGLSAPGSAVDMFMLLSGFLMVHTTRRTLQLNTDRDHVWRFYVSRWFRIAPLYYVLLLVCWLGSAWLSGLSQPWYEAVFGTQAQAHMPKWHGLETAAGIWAHVTFVFGFIPSLASSTLMPDWSLALEMQFYLVFPLLCLWGYARPAVLVPLAVVATAFAIVGPWWFGKYGTPGSIAHFTQPSLLPLKLHVFLAGMLVATSLAGLRDSRADQWRMAIAAICILPSRPIVWVLFTAWCFMLWAPRTLPARLLSVKFMRVLGDLSYGVYLTHVILMAPVLYWLQTTFQVGEMPVWTRYGISLAACSTLVFPVCWVLHHLIEKPMISVGHRINKRPR